MFLFALFSAALISPTLAQYPYAQLVAPNWPVVAWALPEQPATLRNVRTTYLIACPASSNQYQCDFVQPMTFVQGPSTVAYNYTGLGGIGSVTISMECELTSTTYVACTVQGGVRSTSGPSTDVIIEGSTPATVIWTGTEAASLFKNIQSVYSSSSLLTYTPPGATVSAVTTVFTNTASPSSTASGQITAPATSTPSSSATSDGRMQRRLWKVSGGAIAVLISMCVL